MPYRPTQFCSTVIKPYYKDDNSEPLQDALENALEENYNQCAPEGNYNPNIIIVDAPQPQYSRGCPKGSQNCQHLVDFKEQFVAVIKNGVELLMAFITVKEKADFKLTKQFQKEDCITTLRAFF